MPWSICPSQYSQRLKPKNTVQLVAQLKHSFNQDGILVTTPAEFFNNPPWEIAK
ncbi:MAG TPA: hypothetical protein VHZ76_10080 [Gammaproteobacteria bacterium]|jgi:hypothetical protein|nr:hypothetical protein [Gammaproteobacteria bacterium]